MELKYLIILQLIGVCLALPQDPTFPERQDPTYPDRNGDYHIDDMRLDENQFQLHFGNEEEQRNAIPGDKYRWTNGELPYKFSGEVSAANAEKVKQCLDDFNKNFEGCLNLREMTTTDSNYVEILAGSGCWSQVGMRGGKQELNLQPNGCMSCRTIMHEFMHALGLYHMQSRPDRDNYVKVNFDNIKSGKEHNFNKCSSCLTYDVPYDAKSFMHYRSYYFAIDSSKPTIESISSDFTTSDLGAASALTESDMLLLRRMYGCDTNFTTTPPPCVFPNWKGDGICDDENNVESCGWDGGDCCGDKVVTNYCKECKCLDPAFGATTTPKPDDCKDNWSQKKCKKRKNKGKCNKKKVKKNCQKTCGFCTAARIEDSYEDSYEDFYMEEEFFDEED